MRCILLSYFICTTIGALASDDFIFYLTLKYGIIPDLIYSSGPFSQMWVKYPSGAIVAYGNQIHLRDTMDIPEVKWAWAPESYYTLSLIDAGAIARINGKVPPYLQWLVVNIPGNNVSLGYTVSPFEVKRPTVIKGQGYPERHRYVFLVYEQNEKFDDKELSRFTRLAENRSNFSISDACLEFGMDTPQSINMFVVRNKDTSKNTQIKEIGPMKMKIHGPNARNHEKGSDPRKLEHKDKLEFVEKKNNTNLKQMNSGPNEYSRINI